MSHFNIWFNKVYKSNLVYNQCQEDPRLDKIALELTPSDTMLVITSAGCNILDYLLSDVKEIYAVDMNWRQNALLELKMVMIKQLDYEIFFEFFGKGRILNPKQIYNKFIRNHLSLHAQKFWDKKIYFFDKKNRGFYYYSTAGLYAYILKLYFCHLLRLEKHINMLVSASSIEEQSKLYTILKPKIFSKVIRFFWSSSELLTLLGVPTSQFKLVKHHYAEGVAGLFHDCIEYVMTKTHLKTDNYFWHLYLTGEYTHQCCPNYLKEQEFLYLKKMDLFKKTKIHSQSISDFLISTSKKIDKFVLLDHFDWFYLSKHMATLQHEWQLILKNASPNARIIWRSVGLNINWMNSESIMYKGDRKPLFEYLNFNQELSEKLHIADRYHTYGSFLIADIKGC